MYKKYLFLIIFIVFVCLAWQLSAQYHGTSPFWTTPHPLPKPHSLGDMTKGGIGTNLLRMSTGELVQCFVEKFPYPAGQDKIYFAKSTDDGNTWTILKIDTPFVYTSINYSPTIAIDAMDNIHIIWFRKVPKTDLYYAKFDKNFHLLIDTVKISAVSFFNSLHSPYITVDRKNRVHVMWHDGSTDSLSNPKYFARVMYRQSPDGGRTWVDQQILSDTSIQKHAAYPRADFSGTNGDTIAIPWRQEVNYYRDWDVWMAYSTDGGEHWTRSNVAHSDSMEWDPGIVVDKHNRIHLHYHEYKKGNLLMASMEYKYTDDLGTYWSPIQTLSPTGIRSQLSVFSYDYNMDLQCICWKDERDFINAKDTRADIMCSYSTDNGVSWFGQEFVTDLDTIPVGYKSVDVGSNGVVYLTFEYADSTGRKTIWFTKRDPLTSVQDKSEELTRLTWDIFPNPSSSKIFIVSPTPHYTACLFDIVGREVLNAEGKKSLDVTGLPPGIYILKISSDTFFTVRKVIIKK